MTYLSLYGEGLKDLIGFSGFSGLDYQVEPDNDKFLTVFARSHSDEAIENEAD